MIQHKKKQLLCAVHTFKEPNECNSKILRMVWWIRFALKISIDKKSNNKETNFIAKINLTIYYIHEHLNI